MRSMPVRGERLDANLEEEIVNFLGHATAFGVNAKAVDQFVAHLFQAVIVRHGCDAPVELQPQPLVFHIGNGDTRGQSASRA